MCSLITHPTRAVVVRMWLQDQRSRVSRQIERSSLIECNYCHTISRSLTHISCSLTLITHPKRAAVVRMWLQDQRPSVSRQIQRSSLIECNCCHTISRSLTHISCSLTLITHPTRAAVVRMWLQDQRPRVSRQVGGSSLIECRCHTISCGLTTHPTRAAVVRIWLQDQRPRVSSQVEKEQFNDSSLSL